MPPFIRTLIEAVIGLAAIALVWAIAALIIDRTATLPMLAAVLRKAVELAPSDDYLRHVVDSGTALLLGLLPALVAGVLLGLIAGLSPATRWLFGPFAVALGGAPLLVLIPVFLAWWGLAMMTKAATVFVVAAFPIANAVMTAVSVKRNRAKWAADLNLRVRAWGGAPSPACAIFASLRLGVVLGVTALVIVEFLVPSRGVGYFIVQSANAFDTTATMAGIVLVVVPTTLVAAFLQAIEEQVGA